MGRKHTVDKILSALFESKRADLTTAEQAMVARYEATFTIWLEAPYKSDTQIRDYLMDTHGVSKSQAYRDIAKIKLYLGNVSNAARAWQQYKVNNLLDRATEAAFYGDHNMAKSLTNIAKELTRANRLNLIEGEQIPWDDIVPQVWEPSNDPTTAGLKPIPNLENVIDNLKKRYGEDIQDIDYQDISKFDDGAEEDIL